MQHSSAALLALLLAGATLPARAQTAITIDRNDLPNAGDTLRVSQTVELTGPALTQTGANQTWNYSGLRPVNQQVERYQAVSSTPGILPIFFGLLPGPNRATIAARQDLAVLAGAGLPVSDVYSFFNESAADYRQVGFGVVVQGTALPVAYQSQALQDVVYRFPLSYAKRDSSNSEFVAEVPTVAYLRQTQKRVNRADGWGTLTTPFGTFAALRVVSTLQIRDSLSLPGQPGVAVQLPVTREYKWLGKNQGIPLLRVTTQLVAGREIVTLVQYRDIYRRLTPLATQPQLPETAVAAYPSPAGASESLRVTLPGSGPVTLTATDLSGRVLFRQTRVASGPETVIPAAAFGAFRGMALLRVQTATGVAVRRVVRE